MREVTASFNPLLYSRCSASSLPKSAVASLIAFWIFVSMSANMRWEIVSVYLLRRVCRVDSSNSVSVSESVSCSSWGLADEDLERFFRVLFPAIVVIQCQLRIVSFLSTWLFSAHSQLQGP